MGGFRGVELDGVQLTGDRLLLRRWQPGDAARVAAVMADRSMHRYLALPDPYRLEDAREFVDRIGHEGRAAGTGLGSAVVERATGRVVGSAAIRLTADPEIGFWIAPDAQGNGYAAEVTRLLAEWGLGLGLPRIRVLCDVTNLPSARSALAAGFRFEGVARNGYAGGGAGGVAELRGDLAVFARLADDPPGRVPYAFPPLPETGRADAVLRIRTTAGADAVALAEGDDELTVRWNFTGRPVDPADVRRDADGAALQWLVGSTAAFSMVDLDSGRIAGSLRLRHAGPPQVGGVGYVVHPDFRGRRFATRALRLLVPWAFDVADFARLELGAKVGNEPSLRAAAAAGFEPDGRRRARLRNGDGTFSDELRYALVNPRYADGAPTASS
jgi:RimJ/RimL family protein N-acetyltransferase